MKNLCIRYTALLMLAAAFAGCRQEEAKQADPEQCDALYNDLLRVYKAYSDSLAMIPTTDTTDRVTRLEAALDKAVWEIAKRYPMNMDRHLSEAQNDTLWYYTEKYVEARNAHRHKQIQQPDSTTALQDSLSLELNN